MKEEDSDDTGVGRLYPLCPFGGPHGEEPQGDEISKALVVWQGNHGIIRVPTLPGLMSDTATTTTTIPSTTTTLPSFPPFGGGDSSFESSLKVIGVVTVVTATDDMVTPTTSGEEKQGVVGVVVVEPDTNDVSVIPPSASHMGGEFVTSVVVYGTGGSRNTIVYDLPMCDATTTTTTTTSTPSTIHDEFIFPPSPHHGHMTSKELVIGTGMCRSTVTYFPPMCAIDEPTTGSPHPPLLSPFSDTVTNTTWKLGYKAMSSMGLLFSCESHNKSTIPPLLLSHPFFSGGSPLPSPLLLPPPHCGTTTLHPLLLSTSDGGNRTTTPPLFPLPPFNGSPTPIIIPPLPLDEEVGSKALVVWTEVKRTTMTLHPLGKPTDGPPPPPSITTRLPQYDTITHTWWKKDVRMVLNNKFIGIISKSSHYSLWVVMMAGFFFMLFAITLIRWGWGVTGRLIRRCSISGGQVITTNGEDDGSDEDESGGDGSITISTTAECGRFPLSHTPTITPPPTPYEATTTTSGGPASSHPPFSPLSTHDQSVPQWPHQRSSDIIGGGNPTNTTPTKLPSVSLAGIAMGTEGSDEIQEYHLSHHHHHHHHQRADVEGTDKAPAAAGTTTTTTTMMMDANEGGVLKQVDDKDDDPDFPPPTTSTGPSPYQRGDDDMGGDDNDDPTTTTLPPVSLTGIVMGTEGSKDIQEHRDTDHHHHHHHQADKGTSIVTNTTTTMVVPLSGIVMGMNANKGGVLEQADDNDDDPGGTSPPPPTTTTTTTGPVLPLLVLTENLNSSSDTKIPQEQGDHHHHHHNLTAYRGDHNSSITRADDILADTNATTSVGGGDGSTCGEEEKQQKEEKRTFGDEARGGEKKSTTIAASHLGGDEEKEKEEEKGGSDIKQKVEAFFTTLPDCHPNDLQQDHLVNFLQSFVPPQYIKSGCVNATKKFLHMKLSQQRSSSTEEEERGKVTSAQVAVLWEWMIGKITDYKEECHRVYDMVLADSGLSATRMEEEEEEEEEEMAKVMKGKDNLKAFMDHIAPDHRPLEVDKAWLDIASNDGTLEIDRVITYFVGREWKRRLRKLREDPLPDIWGGDTI